jgi:hypothetical protein
MNVPVRWDYEWRDGYPTLEWDELEWDNGNFWQTAYVHVPWREESMILQRSVHHGAVVAHNSDCVPLGTYAIYMGKFPLIVTDELAARCWVKLFQEFTPDLTPEEIT